MISLRQIIRILTVGEVRSYLRWLRDDAVELGEHSQVEEDDE